MRRVVSSTIVTLATCSLLLTACGEEESISSGGQGTSSDSQGSTEVEAHEPSTEPEDVFADVLAHPESVQARGYRNVLSYTATGTYSYAFHDLTGDGFQDMVLRIDSEEVSPVVVLAADGKGGYHVCATGLGDGATGGGSFYSVRFSTEEPGLISIEGSDTFYTSSNLLVLRPNSDDPAQGMHLTSKSDMDIVDKNGPWPGEEVNWQPINADGAGVKATETDNDDGPHPTISNDASVAGN